MRDSLFEVSFITISTNLVNSSYFRLLTSLQNFFTANKSAFNIGLIYFFKFVFPPTALNFLGPFTAFFTILLAGLFPFLTTVFLPDNSRTLNIRLPCIPDFLGATLPPFLLAAISAPLSTSNPTGGANKSWLSFETGFGSGAFWAVSSNVTTELKISSKKSSGDIFVLLLLSSF